MRRVATILLALLTAATAAYAQVPAQRSSGKGHGAAPAVHRRRPIVFEQNVGQFPEDTIFAAHGPEESLSISKRGDVTLNGQSIRLAQARQVPARGEQPTNTSIRYLGAKPLDAPSYGKVVFADVLRGIDWVWHAGAEGIESSFIVHPGASPGAIALQFDRASRLRIEDGNLIVTAQGRQTTHRRPRAYQEIGGARKTVTATWRISGRHARFALGRYDRRATLVIDPTLTGRPPVAH